MKFSHPAYVCLHSHMLVDYSHNNIEKDTCFYENVIVTDHYRKGCPYLRFNAPGSSTCTITFFVHEKKDHVITLRHCLRMTKGYAKVDIKLNDIIVKRTGQSQAVQLKIIDEDIKLPAAQLTVGKPNVLTILLSKKSPVAYWLSDIYFPVRVAQAQAQASSNGSANPQT